MADDERSESSPSDELANADRIDKDAPTVPPQQPTGESRSDSRSTSEKPSAQHEFDSQENKVIQDLASAMHWIAAPFLFLGVLYIFATIVCLIQVFRQPASIFAVIYVGLVAILFLALGRWTKQAAVSFQQIVSTSGRDMSHLMDALESLRKKYSLLSVFVKIYVAIILLALIAAAVTLIIGAFSQS